MPPPRPAEDYGTRQHGTLPSFGAKRKEKETPDRCSYSKSTFLFCTSLSAQVIEGFSQISPTCLCKLMPRALCPSSLPCRMQPPMPSSVRFSVLVLSRTFDVTVVFRAHLKRVKPRTEEFATKWVVNKRYRQKPIQEEPYQDSFCTGTRMPHQYQSTS